ncbi:MAG TPA: hypothetical protein VEK15_03760 [Vicinamibacteria bacterium]|nr:hypothetical protein [Vicinamibacteria bacterium]
MMDFGTAQRTRSGQDTDADTLTRLTADRAYLGTLAYSLRSSFSIGS